MFPSSHNINKNFKNSAKKNAKLKKLERIAAKQVFEWHFSQQKYCRNGT